MEWLSETLSFSTNGKGMYEIKENIFREIKKWKIATGMCFLFLPHTSASLTLCESWDPQSRKDVESYYDRAVPEKDLIIVAIIGVPRYLAVVYVRPNIAVTVESKLLYS